VGLPAPSVSAFVVTSAFTGSALAVVLEATLAMVEFSLLDFAALA
jgi:hypothetical protein